MKKKVLFIITSVHQGGLETYLLRFLEREKDKINPIVMYRKIEFDKNFFKEYKKTNAKMVCLPLNFSPLSMYKFYVFLKRENVRTVCDFRGDFAGISLTISWLAKVKTRIVFYRESVHQFEPNFLKNRYIKIINFLTKKFSTKMLSNSSEAFVNFYKPNILNNKYHRVIKNGVYNENDFIKKIDIRSNLGIPLNAFVVGHIGRYIEAKNHNVIIETAKILCKKDPMVYFLLCGKDVRSGILDKLNEYDLHDNIITPGLCKNIPSHLHAMNVFLFPSLNEGQPNALIEAMNAGIPIVASNIPSIIETVRRDMNKALFSPNAVHDYVSQIEAIKKGNSVYNIDEIEKWSKEIYSQKNRFEEFYKELF